MKTTTLASNNPMNRSSCPLVLLLIPLALGCFALSPQARATCQQGCLTNGNTVLGDDALISNTGGDDNTAIGFNALFSNTDGSFNTAIGFFALARNITGTSNTALGFTALSLNTTGIYNTAIGSDALQVNSGGNFNTAIGKESLQNNTTGSNNTATGVTALESNTTGGENTATGISALQDNTTGDGNTANGTSALQNNTTGGYNTAVGNHALLDNTTGSNNTAVGEDALSANIKGRWNTAMGSSALDHCRRGIRNIGLGYAAGTMLDFGEDNIYIANPGQISEFNTTRIGTSGIHTTTFIAGVNGATVPDGVGVIVGADGHLGTVVSSARYKDTIKPMDKVSEAILALKPVTFRYKHELDPKGIPQFGLVAEDVEKVNPDLVARDEKDKPYTVRYDAVNAMLLNEFLKEHRKVESLEKAMAEQQKDSAAMRAMLKEQATQIQKVSARLEVTKTAPQTVLNNR